MPDTEDDFPDLTSPRVTFAPLVPPQDGALRDWFAGLAMASLLAGAEGPVAHIASGVARAAYQQADSMLAERAKGRAQ